MTGAEVLIGLQVASAAAGVIGGFQQASAAKKAANANIANEQQANLLQQRQADSQRRRVLGSQTTALAASGVDVNTGTSLDLYQDTSEQTLLDKAVGNFNSLSRQQAVWRDGQQKVNQGYGNALKSSSNLLSAGSAGYDSWSSGDGNSGFSSIINSNASRSGSYI